MPRKKNYSREEVIAKAMKVFWDNGYTATSMRTLEKEMGINLFSIYAGFDSKHGVFLEALEQYQTLNKTVILRKLLESQGELEDVRIFFHDFVTSVKSGQTPNGCLFANTAIEFGETDEAVAKRLQAFFGLLQQAYIQLLQQAQRKGNISETADIEKYANYLVGCTEGVAVIAKVLDEKRISDFIDTTISALV